MKLKTTIFTHRPRVSLARFSFCWWRHNQLLMTSQWPDNCHVITWIMISNSLDVDFIHGDIHGRSCKNWNHFCYIQFRFRTRSPAIWYRKQPHANKIISNHINVNGKVYGSVNEWMIAGRWVNDRVSIQRQRSLTSREISPAMLNNVLSPVKTYSSGKTNGNSYPNFWSLCLQAFQHRLVLWQLQSHPDSKIHEAIIGAHLGPTGPRWAPCWPHELCYLGSDDQVWAQ